ncbi:RNA polymerase sigma factor [Microbacterium sp. SORGH_AS_0888]|uniref:RNA polymerase sigma factor n=1 Tax=Microbacterium sp. SORGH_AS_0888 TaxID=3041791 RepID=UPI0027D8D821|nr:RNA polymerase sigma factor [Microbacterium sp. SORGH_AS_0888]
MISIESASDAVLAGRAADGDTDAFAVLMRRHAPYLIAFATRMMSSRADAEDCVQEAFITAWQKLPSLDAPERVRSWLSTIVVRKVNDRFRQRHPVDSLEGVDVADAAVGPEERAELGSQVEQLRRALAGLPDDVRVAWVMREIGGHSYQEIAAQTGATESTVRGRIARARRAVMQNMEDWR